MGRSTSSPGPAVLGAASRVLVVLATNSWQAYNFYDVDGDCWGTCYHCNTSMSSCDANKVNGADCTRNADCASGTVPMDE